MASRDEWPGARDYLAKVLFGPWQKEFMSEAGRAGVLSRAARLGWGEVTRLIRAGPEPALKSSALATDKLAHSCFRSLHRTQAVVGER